MKKTAGLFLALAVGMSACSKIPESETARKVGSQPKQVIDKAASDVTKSLQTGTEKRQGEESKQSGDK